MAQNNANADEIQVYAVTVNVATNELVARDERGQELARVSGEGTHDDHAELARKASETLASWYN